MKPIPPGPKDLICPMHRKSMAKVCHTCPLWMAINDDWNCALVWGPLQAAATAKEMYTAGREVNAMRNEAAKAHAEHLTLGAIAVQRSNDTFRDAVASYALPSNPVPASQNLIEAAE